MNKLAGKYAIITGAGKGIGAAIAKRFLDDGAAGVALIGRDYNRLKLMADWLDATKERTLVIPCDVSDGDAVHTAVESIHRRFGRIDILVNNAGITKDCMFHKMPLKSWDEVLETNLTGPFNMCREVFPIMRTQNYGHIINISSISAAGMLGQSNYAASKAGLIGLTKTLAIEGASKGIVVNAVAPGYIETDMLKAVPESTLDTFLKKIPMNRFGRPEEVASVVSFLASDDSSFVSGQCLIVSGAAET